MAIIRNLLITCVLTFVVGCDMGPKSARGFTLPDGDVELGKAAFTQFRCYDCHSIQGVEMPVAEEQEQVAVQLGGKVERIKTYGELVTAIINPSHRLARGYADSLVSTPEGESRMTNYNDVMTVTQLINLVAFLQSHYELQSYDPTMYPPYYMSSSVNVAGEIVLAGGRASSPGE